jgi:peptidoglycan/xylan/chitin deacetylase (PgdA/CDA1 family)
MHDTLVLCYHAFSHAWKADLSVKPALFAQQLALLAEAGYRGVTFSEAVRRQARHKEVAITFDDAFESVVAHARPVLDELGWPATIYAVTDYAREGRPVAWPGVDQWAGGPYDDELGTLDWDGLRDLRDAGWEVGSHTVTHPHLTQLGDDELERELVESRAAVEAALGEPCDSIAYPYGDVDPRVIDAAGRAGYATGAALPAHWGEVGALEWPRVGVYRPDDLRRFRLKTSRWTRRARSLLGR